MLGASVAFVMASCSQRTHHCQSSQGHSHRAAPRRVARPPGQRRTLWVSSCLLPSLILSTPTPEGQLGILPSCSTHPVVMVSGNWPGHGDSGTTNGIIKTQVKGIITAMEPFYLTWFMWVQSPNDTVTAACHGVQCADEVTRWVALSRGSVHTHQSSALGPLRPEEPCSTGATG